LKIVLQRTVFTEESTIGQLMVNNRFECHTLEDRDRFLEDGSDKVYAKTAIPRGVYRVTRTLSNRFKRVLPILRDVPNFTGVRIHTGNKAEDTEGCILVGTYKPETEDWISNSRDSFKKLDKKIEDAINDGEAITLEVI